MNDLDDDEDSWDPGELEDERVVMVEAMYGNRTQPGVSYQYLPTNWMPVYYVRDDREQWQAPWGWWS